MKFRGQFNMGNLHHFVGCLLSLSRLAVEQSDMFNSLLRITRDKVSIITKTVLHSEGYLEINTDELFNPGYSLIGDKDDTIALNISVNSLFETLNAAVNSDTATLKLKRNGETTTLSVTFPDRTLPSISITLDIVIMPTKEYIKTDSVMPMIPPCRCNIGITKCQSLICYLETAHKMGNEYTEFEVYTRGKEQTICTPRNDTDEVFEKRFKPNSDKPLRTTIKKNRIIHSTKHSDSDSSDIEWEETDVLLKVKSPGLLAELETTFQGLQAFSSYDASKPKLNPHIRPKTVLRTDSIYSLCKNAVDSIIYNKHEALLVVAIPDDYEAAEWTFFILSVTSLESCQMVFSIHNYVH